MLIICWSAFYHYQEKAFSAPVPILLEEQKDTGYIAKFELEPNINYGLVVSAVLDSSNVYYYKKAPIVLIDGKRIFLQGGKSIFAQNLALDFRWIKKSRIIFETRYYGYFSLPKACDCILSISGHAPNWLKEYKLQLYRDVDESYFWLAGLTFFCLVLVITSGWGYILLKIILGIKIWLFKIKT